MYKFEMYIKVKFVISLIIYLNDLFFFYLNRVNKVIIELS